MAAFSVTRRSTASRSVFGRIVPLTLVESRSDSSFFSPRAADTPSLPKNVPQKLKVGHEAMYRVVWVLGGVKVMGKVRADLSDVIHKAVSLM